MNTIERSEQTSESQRILLVEDDDRLSTVLQRALTSFGYQVVRARNGNEALKLYNQDSISVVLTDLVMPDKEGIELIGELRRINPQIKIIAMSGGQIRGS